MKRMMSIVAIALFVSGSSAFACTGCGCAAKKAETNKTECASCTKPAETKKCAEGCTKECCKKAKEAK